MIAIRLSWIVFALSCLATAGPAVAQTPGPYSFTLIKDRPITYSDGYRTMLDIRVPDATPPSRGWPVAMIVHGGGGSRKRDWVVANCEILAANGYLTLAYDTGGNGVTVNLNPPGRRPEANRIRDLAEIFYFAEQLLGPRMDETRIGIMGKSGGGKHTLWAASYSGQPLPLGSALVTHMPKILAAHSDIQVLDFLSDMLPQDSLIRAEWAISQITNAGPNDPVSKMLLARDYAGLKSYVMTTVGLNIFPLLRQSGVPLLVSYSYDDKNHSVNVNADAFPKLKAGVPRRYLQLTGGHASAGNDTEVALRRDFTRRWFDRFVNGVKNDVEKEPFAEIAMIANDENRYLDPRAPWKHRRSAVWPILPNQRLYLRTGGKLLPAAPTGIEAGPTLPHRVKPGYDMAGFVQDGGTVSEVLKSIPFASVTFDTPPMDEPRELLGRTIVEFDVLSTAANYQLSAALLDVAPSQTPRFITTGVSARRSVVPGRHRIRIEIGDVGYVLRKGHVLRLSIENLNVHRQPGNPHFFVAPDFENGDFTVVIDATFPPRVDLPMNPARASLLPRIGRASAGSGFTFPFRLEGESSRAGNVYQVLVGASGNTPGLAGPEPIPLNPDLITMIAIRLTNTPFLPDFFGTLDAKGDATPTLQLPSALANALVGLRLTVVGGGVTGSNRLFVTNLSELVVEP